MGNHGALLHVLTLVCSVHFGISLNRGSVLMNHGLFKRMKSTSNDIHESNIDCIQMVGEGGEYRYTSPGDAMVCGLYLIGMHNQLVELEFTSFDIDCETEGLLAVVDGWELQGQFFPSDADHPKPEEERYQQFCGLDKPKRKIISSQNVALIQYRIPSPGEGFRIRVRFIPNPQPCNAVSLLDTGVFTLKNYGKRSNCSISIVYPEAIQFVSVDVGVAMELPIQTTETGLTTECTGRHDYVELLDGDGLDPGLMWGSERLCGLASEPIPYRFTLGCQHSVVRLVSSGNYYNSVTFEFAPLTHEEEALVHNSPTLCN